MYLIFFILSALALSIMDALYYQYDKTIFHKMSNQNFWDPLLSIHKKKVFFFQWGAINIAKALAIILLIAATILVQLPFFQIKFLSLSWQLFTALIVYITAYNIGYLKLFVSKNSLA